MPPKAATAGVRYRASYIRLSSSILHPQTEPFCRQGRPGPLRTTILEGGGARSFCPAVLSLP
jgi:hypothetical protein